MSLSSQNEKSPYRPPEVDWLSDPLHIPVEQIVSFHLGRTWRVQHAQDMTDFACHRCAILTDGFYGVFVKFSDEANGLEQFEVELAGLRLLTERSGILTPTPITAMAVDGGAVLVLEAVQAVERGPRQWRAIGQTLARIHRIRGAHCGLETQGYWGTLDLDNRPIPDWPTFYAERRLWPLLNMAIAAGNIPPEAVRQVEQVIARLPELCGPVITPVLLHGDAQKNNYISSEHGAVVIDPAVHYGHPEFDLASINYFEAVPDDVFAGYQEEMPIDPGFHERRNLWHVAYDLGGVISYGPDRVPKLIAGLQKYL